MTDAPHVATPLRKHPAPVPTLPGQEPKLPHPPPGPRLSYNVSVGGEITTYHTLGPAQHAVDAALREAKAGSYLSVTVTPAEVL